VMERFMWQSYPQYLQNTLFHSEKLEQLRKKTLQDRLTQAYEFKAKGDEKLEAAKPREAVVQFEYAYGLFKYCEKQGRKITVVDDSKAAREMRQAQGTGNDAFSQFWLQVDELVCSCLVMIAQCNLLQKSPNCEQAVSATTEALEVRPDHPPALYRRSQAQAKLEQYSEAVADSRAAFNNASGADERVRRHLYLHMRALVAERRRRSLWWGFVGLVEDMMRKCGWGGALIIVALVTMYYFTRSASIGTADDASEDAPPGHSDGWLDDSEG